ncbi:discoidin domain-containing protein, partial [Micromonospora sp. LOL_023]|uniref:discoidin domain-containing protein n=1 Tax=Micromonospora sp. LOL_023 TaxID=3345418 RepID=UPI003A841537
GPVDDATESVGPVDDATESVGPVDDATEHPDDELPPAGQMVPARFWRLPDPPAATLTPSAASEPITQAHPARGATLLPPVAEPPPLGSMRSPMPESAVRSLSDPTVPVRIPVPAEPPKGTPSRRNLRAGLVAAAFVAIVAVASGAAAQIGNAGGSGAEVAQSDSPAASVPAWTPEIATPYASVSATGPGVGAESAPVTVPSTVAVGRTESAPRPTTAGPPTPTRTTAPAPVPVRTTAPAPVPQPVTGRTNSSGRNLALGVAVTASSAEGRNWGPALAVDGDRSTRWASTWQDPQWIRVDLGENWVVNEVRLAWESAHATSYRVEVSRDGVNWTTVFGTSSGTGGTVVVEVPSVVARHVRMYGTSRSGTYGYSLYEFEVR